MKQPHPPEILKTAVLLHDGNLLEGPLGVVVKTLLRKQYRTLSFTDASQALKAATDLNVDLLLIHLPTAREQGYELCRTLRHQPATRHLPIVFTDLSIDSPARIEMLRCGASECWPLPILPEECWLSLKHHLEAYRLVRQLQVQHLSLSQQIGRYSDIFLEQERLKISLTEENLALQKLAFVDELTQVGNRRQFKQSIAQLWKTAEQQYQPISLLMCDVDYFKRYNDTYGHLAGDACLRAVATALVQGTRRYSTQRGIPNSAQVASAQISRYGGEEFVILLPGVNTQNAQQVARSVQAAVARTQIPHKGSLVKPWVSISIGIHTLTPARQQQSYERLIYGADKALYKAKLRGRDRIVTTTLPESTERITPECTAPECPNRATVSSIVFPTRFAEYVA